MAFVNFLRGSQDNLGKLSSYNEGSFYLTNDTDRLYFAQSDSELVRLTNIIHQVANFKMMPSYKDAIEGDFYYCVEENIFCVKGPENWIQINPDTNTNDDTKVTGLTFTSDKIEDGIKVSFVLSQATADLVGNKTNSIEDITGDFTLTAEQIGSMITDASVGVSGDLDAQKNIVIKTSGVGANEELGVKLVKGVNVSFKENNDNSITIDSSTYDLKANGEEIYFTESLDDKVNSKMIFGFKGGNQTSVTSELAVENNDSAGSYFRIHHAKISDETGLSVEVPEGKDFSYITGLTLENGHITGITQGDFALPEEKKFSIESISADNLGKLKIVYDINDVDTTVTSKQQDLYYKIGETSYYNQATLPVYTSSEIDNLLKGLNAVVYKGTVQSTDHLESIIESSGGMKVGYAYMISDFFYLGDNFLNKGDLIIANGNEDDNGFLDPDNIEWDIIPSGDEVDTTYDLSISELKDKIASILLSGTNNTNDTIGIGLDEDDKSLEIKFDTQKNAILLNHKDYTYTGKTADEGNHQTPAAGESFSIITSLDVDNGHITGYKTSNVTLPADKDTTYDLNVRENVSGENKSIYIDLTSPGNETDSIQVIEGLDIVITKGNNSLTFGHKGYQKVENPEISDTTLGYGDKVKVISGLTIENGHITGISTADYTLPQSDNTTYTLGAEQFENNSGIGIALTSSGEKTAVAFASDSLKVSLGSNMIKYDLEWGSF